jgi:hypothetical protein
MLELGVEPADHNPRNFHLFRNRLSFSTSRVPQMSPRHA